MGRTEVRGLPSERPARPEQLRQSTGLPQFPGRGVGLGWSCDPCAPQALSPHPTL